MASTNPSIKSILPSCWEDDVRMNVLFSNFRSQSVNPTGWQDKMNFWVNLITDYCHQTKSVMFTHEELCLIFERHGCVPQCLKAVLDHMDRQGNTMSVAEFSRIPSQKKSWLNWGYDVLLYRPVTWGLSAFQNAMHWNQKDDRYVMISVVQDLASKILRRHTDQVNSQWTDNVIFLEALEEQCKDICTGMSLQMALIQMQKDSEALLIEVNGMQVVKFRAKDEAAVSPLSEIDHGILRLQKARDSVQKEVDKADYEIDRCIQDAKHFLKVGCKTKAMMCLKRKKRVDKLLQKKVATLDNIEHLLCQLQESTSEKMVLQAYNAGVLAMKSAVKGGLDLDNIDTTMADVEEMLETAHEIQDAVSKPVGPVAEQDMSAFEEELEELLSADSINVSADISVPAQRASTSDENVLDKLLNLPAPPTSVSPLKVGVSSKTAPIQRQMVFQ